MTGDPCIALALAAGAALIYTAVASQGGVVDRWLEALRRRDDE